MPFLVKNTSLSDTKSIVVAKNFGFIHGQVEPPRFETMMVGLFSWERFHKMIKKRVVYTLIEIFKKYQY